MKITLFLEYLRGGGQYYKPLRIRNVLEIVRFWHKLVPHIVNHKHTDFDKHTSLLRNPNITNL